jgi:PAS domain-containing protein
VDVSAGTFWKSHNLPAIFGRSDSEFADTYEGFFAYIHPEDRDFFRLASIAGRQDQRDYEINHRIICGDGTIRRVHTRGRMYVDESGAVTRMVGTVYAINSLPANPSLTPPVANANTAEAR